MKGKSYRTAAWVVVKTPTGYAVLNRKLARMTPFEFVSSHRWKATAQEVIEKLKIKGPRSTNDR